jgi:hypothetical protein
MFISPHGRKTNTRCCDAGVTTALRKAAGRRLPSTRTVNVLRSLLLLLTLASSAPQLASTPVKAADSLQPGTRVWLHAHNCYPEKGLWSDRLDRALASRPTVIAIEQDVAWSVDAKTGRGRSVVSHEPKTTGTEPALEEHFFTRVRPVMERALAESKRDTWPLMVLHLDFKTNEPAHHEAVWDLLGRHLAWLTTAERVADEQRVTPFAVGPLLVLTENGDGQADTFHTRVKIGERLRLFGTIPAMPLTGKTAEERAAEIFAATPSSAAVRPRRVHGRQTMSVGFAASSRARTREDSGFASTR